MIDIHKFVRISKTFCPDMLWTAVRSNIHLFLPLYTPSSRHLRYTCFGNMAGLLLFDNIAIYLHTTITGVTSDYSLTTYTYSHLELAGHLNEQIWHFHPPPEGLETRTLPRRGCPFTGSTGPLAYKPLPHTTWPSQSPPPVQCLPCCQWERYPRSFFYRLSPSPLAYPKRPK